MGHISKVYALSEEEFIALCESEINYSAVSRALGYGEVGTYTFELIKKRLTELNRQDLMDKLGSRQLASYGYQPMISSDEDIQRYFAKNTHHGTTAMRRILLRKGLVKYECYHCGNQGSWQGQELNFNFTIQMVIKIIMKFLTWSLFVPIAIHRLITLLLRML